MDKEREKLSLVLDLDETLFYSTEKRSELSDRPHDFEIYDEYTRFRVFKRHGLDDFLERIFNNEKLSVGIWTSANKSYVDGIVSALFSDKKLSFVFDSSRLVKQKMPIMSMYGLEGYELKKDLQKVIRHTGASIERIIAIDDKPSFYTRNYGNLIAVPGFYGDKSKQDNTLELLADYIERLERVDNVRKVEKRGWINSQKKDFTPAI
jgi:TFIIF-interacting CTD phosphatase-like protein